MEIKRPTNIPTRITDLGGSKESEKISADKPASFVSIPDSVEVAKSDPFGDALDAAQQSEGYTGEAQLNSEQQDVVSKFRPEDETFEKSSSFLEDARTRSEESKNSGAKSDVNSALSGRLHTATAEDLFGLKSGEQTSDAVKDANHLLDGDTIREQFDSEVAGRHSDVDAVGGSTSDRLSNLLNPTAKGPQQDKTAGTDMISGDIISSTDTKDQRFFGLLPDKSNTHRFVNYHDGYLDIIEDTTEQDIFGNVTKTISKGSTLAPDGTKTTSTVVHENGQTTTTVTEESDRTYSKVHYKEEVWVTDKYDKLIDHHKSEGDKKPQTVKIPTDENGTASFPDAVKKVMDYFKQQATGMKPQTGPGYIDFGGEGGDPTVGSVDSRDVENRLIRNSGVDSGDNLLGPTGPQGDGGSGTPGTVGPDTGPGGAIDYGPDSDKTGYTGPTHKDDPGDVQFGKQEPVAGMSDSRKSDQDDASVIDTDALLDILNQIRHTNPELFTQFLQSLSKTGK